MTTPTVDRLTALQRDYRRRHPQAFAVLAGFADRRGQDLPPWPDWCWVPMAATVAYLSGIPGSGPADIARVAALTAWRLTQGAYVVGEDLSTRETTALRWSTGDSPAAWRAAPVPSVDRLARLPQPCVYLEIPALPDDTPVGPWRSHGVFVHLEWDANTGREELRLVLDTDGTWDGLLGVPVHLTRRTLGRAMADVEAVGRAHAAGYRGADVTSLHDAGPTGHLAGLLVFGILPLIMAVTAPDTAIWALDAPTDGPTPPVRRDGGWRPAGGIRVWQVAAERPRPGLHSV